MSNTELVEFNVIMPSDYQSFNDHAGVLEEGKQSSGSVMRWIKERLSELASSMI